MHGVLGRVALAMYVLCMGCAAEGTQATESAARELPESVLPGADESGSDAWSSFARPCTDGRTVGRRICFDRQMWSMSEIEATLLEDGSALIVAMVVEDEGETRLALLQEVIGEDYPAQYLSVLAPETRARARLMPARGDLRLTRLFEYRSQMSELQTGSARGFHPSFFAAEYGVSGRAFGLIDWTMRTQWNASSYEQCSPDGCFIATSSSTSGDGQCGTLASVASGITGLACTTSQIAGWGLLGFAMGSAGGPPGTLAGTVGGLLVGVAIGGAICPYHSSFAELATTAVCEYFEDYASVAEEDLENFVIESRADYVPDEAGRCPEGTSHDICEFCYQETTWVEDGAEIELVCRSYACCSPD